MDCKGPAAREFSSTTELYKCMQNETSTSSLQTITKIKGLKQFSCSKTVAASGQRTNKSVKIYGASVPITKLTYTLKQQPNYVRIIYKLKDKYLFQYWGNHTGHIKAHVLPLIQAAKLHFEEQQSI